MDADVSAPQPLRVLIADDHVPTRVGIRVALEGDGFVVCAEEATASGAVAAALRDPPDVCLLEVDMPGGGIEAVIEATGIVKGYRTPAGYVPVLEGLDLRVEAREMLAITGASSAARRRFRVSSPRV